MDDCDSTVVVDDDDDVASDADEVDVVGLIETLDIELDEEDVSPPAPEEVVLVAPPPSPPMPTPSV